ncbi:MAG: Mur ligase family protein [Chloroflexota bacterium]
MPNDGQSATGGDHPAELLELRVLDGPNRFFTRPAVKLEFGAATPGPAADAAATAGLAIRRLHVALEYAAPRITLRTSADRQRVALAFPWRRRAIAQSIAAASARLALGQTNERRELRSLRSVTPGPRPDLPRPRVPIVGVTGTNGKSTTTRLIAHIAESAGLRTGMTNSDGIYVRGELIEAGDWTGFGGAARVLTERALDLAVLETARGGILLRGIGYPANDVSVVTNVSADHLGLQGIDTLEELADVKAAVVRITKRSGWAVLNAADPLVWAMRRQTKARWYTFSADPDAPQVEAALDNGGRAAILQRGWLVLLAPGRAPQRLARAVDLSVTFAGLSAYNVANALAASAAADALGIAPDAIAAGLRSFAQDSAANPGRLNLYERDGRLAIVDFAHNEAGLAGLVEVSRSLATAPGRHVKGRTRGRVRLAVGTAGDRTDEILHNLGVIAAGADDVVICEKRHYLRGRDLEGMNAILRAGIAEGGYTGSVESHPTELAALQALLARARRGDVVAVMAHVERDDIFTWLEAAEYRPVALDRLREMLGVVTPSG